MELYLDESGNLGKKGRYFNIACFCPSNPKRIKNIIKKAHLDIEKSGKKLEEIKAFKLDTSEKQDILNKLVKVDDFTFSYIVADKKHLEQKILDDKNICYNYLASHIFKRIIKASREDIDIIMDNHDIKTKSLNSLKDYIKMEALTKWGYKHNIKFEYQDSKMVKNLQAVDILSNVIYAKYTYGKDHLYNIVKKHNIHSIKFPYKKFNL